MMPLLPTSTTPPSPLPAPAPPTEMLAVFAAVPLNEPAKASPPLPPPPPMLCARMASALSPCVLMLPAFVISSKPASLPVPPLPPIATDICFEAVLVLSVPVMARPPLPPPPPMLCARIP